MHIYAIAMNALYVSSSLSYRVNTRRNCLILRKLRSTILRLLYNLLSYLHGFLRLLFGDTTGRIPHFFAVARQVSPSYATVKNSFALKNKAFLSVKKRVASEVAQTIFRCMPACAGSMLPCRFPKTIYKIGQSEAISGLQSMPLDKR